MTPSYDHRIVDGREVVTFLVRVKENLEDPAIPIRSAPSCYPKRDARHKAGHDDG